MNLIHQDDRGLYIRTNGSKYRPGEISGYSHVHDMSDGELEAGQYVKVRKPSGQPLAFITTPDNRTLAWHVEMR